MVKVDGFSLWLDKDVKFVILSKRTLDCEVEYAAEESVDGTPNIISTDLFPLKSYENLLAALEKVGKIVEEW